MTLNYVIAEPPARWTVDQRVFVTRPRAAVPGVYVRSKGQATNATKVRG